MIKEIPHKIFWPIVILILIAIAIITRMDFKNRNDVKIIKEILVLNGYEEDSINLDNSSIFKWDSNGALKQLVLLDEKVRNIKMLPESIGDFDSINRIVLSNLDKLTELPNSLPNLKYFNTLYINKNIEKLPENFGEIPNLCFLHMESSQITTFPKSFGKLPLRELYMRDTQFNEIPQEVCELDELKRLVIYPEEIKGKMYIPDEIGNLTNLEYLELAGSVSTLPPTIKNLQKLKTLVILGDSPLDFTKEIYEIESLEHLSITFAGLKELPEGISKLKNLHTLVLMNNSITKLPDDIVLMDNWDENHKKEYLEKNMRFGLELSKNLLDNVTPEQDEWLKKSFDENWRETQRN